MSLSKKENFYITTPIYYINDEPHIGHFYCTTAADILARYHRLIGDDVYFVTGTDENSQKTVEAAEKKGMDVKKFTDKMAENWKKTWEKLNISFDFFIRTTSEEHRKSVEKLLNKCYEKGDIYKKEYEGLYCVGCEKFLTKSELTEDGKCPVHKTTPQVVKEENYFFRLSRYEKDLLKLFENKEFALPEERRNEMIEFIKQGLKDISISRATVKWGIPLPIDKSQVVYVWFDALINYITALEYYKDNSILMEKFWGNAIHLVGKDIFRFHTIMWPAMLISAGLTPPKQVFGHGFFTINGEKISKSLKNVIDPVELAEKYGIDAIRYFIMREIPFGKDSDFSIKRLEERYKGDLADVLGNLLNRALNMVEKYNNGVIPKPVRELHRHKNEYKRLEEKAILLKDIIEKRYKKFEFSQLLVDIWNYVKSINKFIDTIKPWELKKKNLIDELMTVLYDILQSLKIIAIYIYPIMPITAEKIYKQLGIEKNINDEDYIEAISWFSLVYEKKIGKREILFPQIMNKEEKMEKKDIKNNENSEKYVTIDEFKKLDIRVAKVLEAEKIEGSNKLLKLKIDIGDGERTLVAGIAKVYKPDELIGKKIIVIKNLKPAKLFGVESQGMLLAATGEKGGPVLLQPEIDIEAGAKIS